MEKQKKYILEYFVSKSKFPDEQNLNKYINEKFGEQIEDYDLEIKADGINYLILCITSTAKG